MQRNPSNPRRFPAWAWLMAGGLIASVFIVFGPACRFEFLNWDDLQQVLKNPHVNPPSWAGVEASWREPYWGLYIPVSYTFLAFEAAIAQRVDPLSGLGNLLPSVFHAGNLLLHAASTLLVFVLLRRLLADREPSAPAPRSEIEGRLRRDAAAGLGALLFAVHPLQVESVAWISEARGLLCGLFSLLMLWQYVEYADARHRPGWRAAFYAGATAALLLALLSKPAAVGLPLMAAVLGVALLRRRTTTVLLDLLPWAAIALFAGLIAKRLQPGSSLAFTPALAARPLIALDSLSFYLGKLVLPLHLSADYGRTPQYVLSGQSFQIGWIVLPAAFIGLAFIRTRRVPLASFALFAAWLVPVLGLMSFDFQRISTVADRYVYLAMLGPALLVAWAVERWWSGFTISVAGAAAASLAAISFLQIGVWRDTGALFAHALLVNPRSAAAQYHLGYLAFLGGQREEAIDRYRKSLASNPHAIEAHIALADALYASGRVKEACLALRETPVNGPAEELLVQKKIESFVSRQHGLSEAGEEVDKGRAEEAAGRIDAARRHYLAAIRIEPRNAKAHYNLGNLVFAGRDWRQAVEEYQTALKYEPEYAYAYANLAAALLQLDKLDAAIVQAKAALVISQNLFPARMTLGQALLRSGSKQEAAVEFRRAYSLAPPGSAQAAEAHKWLGLAEGQ